MNNKMMIKTTNIGAMAHRGLKEPVGLQESKNAILLILIEDTVEEDFLFENKELCKKLRLFQLTKNSDSLRQVLIYLGEQYQRSEEMVKHLSHINNEQLNKFYADNLKNIQWFALFNEYVEKECYCKGLNKIKKSLKNRKLETIEVSDNKFQVNYLSTKAKNELEEEKNNNLNLINNKSNENTENEKIVKINKFINVTSDEMLDYYNDLNIENE